MVIANGVKLPLLIASLCVACATPAPPGAEDVSTATATIADTDLQSYQLRALETHIQKMPDGPEREYFSGMLAARSGRFGDAVARLDRAVPHLRESDPKRAAIALEATGRQSFVRAAVLPMMQVGGAALTNVVLLVIDDANLRIGSGPDAYQINAILGYPILKALGVVTFTRNEFLAGEAAEATGRGVQMYMRGLTPAIECEVEGRPLLFTLIPERRAPICLCGTTSCSVHRLAPGRGRSASARARVARFNRTHTSSHAWS